jgi:hypothetical protein
MEKKKYCYSHFMKEEGTFTLHFILAWVIQGTISSSDPFWFMKMILLVSSFNCIQRKLTATKRANIEKQFNQASFAILGSKVFPLDYCKTQ